MPEEKDLWLITQDYPAWERIGPRIFMIVQHKVIEAGIVKRHDYEVCVHSNIMGEYPGPRVTVTHRIEAAIIYSRLKLRYASNASIGPGKEALIN
jgi:hypothetical protein